jgi:acetoacetyl-CoA synthetase
MRETPLWKPSPERVESASLTAFLRQTGFADYPSLHEWSVESLDSFWKSVWKFTNVVGDPGETAFERGPDILSSRFFPQARLNLAENLLQRHGAAAAIIAIDENGVRRELSWAKLRCQVLAVAGALRNDGVEPGDRVVAWLPLIPEAVILLLATSAIGATFSSTSPDFGVGGVLDRFGQIEPKVLVAATGYQYGGKWFDCLERLREIQRGLGSLQQVVVVERDRADRGSIPDAVLWRDWIRSAEPLSTFESFPFDHPWLVLYSSGTTGKPKCIVHRAGGVF